MSITHDGKFRRKVSYAAVSNAALRDKNLSLKAKGLYALIQSYITMDEFTLYKSFLLSMSTNGERAFNSAWDELKEHGYLKQYRIRDVKGFRYEYELLDEADTNMPSTTNVKLDGSITEDSRSSENSTEEITNICNIDEKASEKIESSDNSAKSYKTIFKEVTENLQLDYAPDDSKDPYALEIRDIIVEVLTSSAKEFRIGGELHNGDEVRAVFGKFGWDHLLYLEESLSSINNEITNPKLYFMTAIYNAVKTMNLSKLAPPYF